MSLWVATPTVSSIIAETFLSVIFEQALLGELMHMSMFFLVLPIIVGT